MILPDQTAQNNPSAPAPASIVSSTPACPTRTSTAAGSAAGSAPTIGATDPAGMTDCTGNGATDQTKILRKSSSYGAPLPIPRRTRRPRPLRDHHWR